MKVSKYFETYMMFRLWGFEINIEKNKKNGQNGWKGEQRKLFGGYSPLLIRNTSNVTQPLAQTVARLRNTLCYFAQVKYSPEWTKVLLKNTKFQKKFFISNKAR